jgi:hypothetical protein
MAASPTSKGKAKAGAKSAAFKELARVSGATPPAELDALSAIELRALAGHVETTLSHHEEAIAEAEIKIIEIAPRPLRRTVRKVLGF